MIAKASGADAAGGVVEVRETVLALLAERAEGATICPSEVARAVTRPTEGWRDAMPRVHAAIDALLREGHVKLSWKGRPMPTRAGPYRIGRPVSEEQVS